MAFGSTTFSNASGAVSDIFGGMATASSLRIKARGNLAEAENYDLAKTLAEQNAHFTETSTALKTYQSERQLYKALGTTTADVAGAGFSLSGSALDLLRDSAAEGALTKATLAEQGAITEAGYEEQAKSFEIMSRAARDAADSENHLAGQSETMGYITGGLKGAAAIASLFI